MDPRESERAQAAQETSESLRSVGLDPETVGSILRSMTSAAEVVRQQAAIDKMKVAQNVSALGIVVAATAAAGAWGTARTARWLERFKPGLTTLVTAADEITRASGLMLDRLVEIATALDQFGETVRIARNAYQEALPANLRQVHNLSLPRLCDFLAEEGVSLYGAPRPSIVEAFLAARDHTDVRVLLGSRVAAIIADCRIAWGEHRTAATKEWIDLLEAATASYEKGHSQAAQALIAVVLDSIVFALPSEHRRRRTKHAFGDTDYKHLLGEDDLATALVAIPLWNAYEQNWAGHAHPVPTRFNRHATLHRASKRQYSKRNTIQALMLATSMVIWYAIYGAPGGQVSM